MARPLNITNYMATIAAGQSLSNSVSIGADGISGIVVPVGWISGPATFQVSWDGLTWQEFYDAAGNEVSLSAVSTAAAAYIGVDSTIWRGVNMFRIRSGTFASPVVQTGGAVLTIVGRGDEW